MGIFSKKPKHPALDAPPMQANSAGIITQPLRAQKPENTPAPRKGKKFSVDPVDFLALRKELFDLKARLEASEQAKVLVETRLAALDATTTAMAADRPGGDDVSTQLAELQEQLDVVAEAAVAAHTAAAKATAAAAASNMVSPPTPAPPSTPDLNLLARLDALTEQLDSIKSAGAMGSDGATDPIVLARLEALTAKVEAGTAADPEIVARLEELAAKVDAGPGPDTLARIEQLAERVAAVDSFGSQLSQINARVTAQAEFGAQLSSLRDRISELSTDTDDRRVAAVAATGDADLRDRLNAISDRIAVNDGLAEQIAQLAERVAANDSTTRQATEQVAAIEQRLNAVSTELANQVSELGRDIDGLAAHSGETAEGVVSGEVVENLRTAQVKLAFEQARYEIAFRQDLATLAEQVRRSLRS